MAEELFQFLLKLKESGVDLSEVDLWFDEKPKELYDGYLEEINKILDYDPVCKEITFTFED